MAKDVVTKDNALNNASYRLDLTEQRLILLAIVAARETGAGIDASTPLVIHASRYAEQFGVDRKTAYESLHDACVGMLKRQFSWQQTTPKGKTEYITSNWVSRCSYVPDDATVSLIFTPDVVPLITRLEGSFTKYELVKVASLTSRYAVRLYEMLIQFRSTGRLIVLLDDFRSKLGLEADEYTRMHHFKARVLDFAVDQINQHTDITVKYTQQKAGRVITGFTFTFKTKATPVVAPARDQNTVDLFSKMTDKQILKFSKLLAELPELGSNAPLGASVEQFADLIANELRAGSIEKYADQLKKVGFAG
jgi:plasmid replication initiation protein